MDLSSFFGFSATDRMTSSHPISTTAALSSGLPLASEDFTWSETLTSPAQALN